MEKSSYMYHLQHSTFEFEQKCWNDDDEEISLRVFVFVSGHHYPATRHSPEEFPECDCYVYLDCEPYSPSEGLQEVIQNMAEQIQSE